MEKTNAWALELEQRVMDEQRKKKACEKKGTLHLLIKVAGVVRLPTCLVNSLIPSSTVIDGAVGLPTFVLMESRNKGTRSLLRQDVQRKPPRETR